MQPTPALRVAMREWCDGWNTPGLSGRVTITLSSRMRTCLGRAIYSRSVVRLNRALIHPDAHDLLREVLCHELAHLAAVSLHGARIRPHGREWRSLVECAGYVPAATYRREALPPSIRELIAARVPRARQSCLQRIWVAIRCSRSNASRSRPASRRAAASITPERNQLL
ncbi:MAG: hypothetical protein EXS03_03330 [Phycisphaerales bacterium]|nr:hypothetical protein [Phycisphaerales bacterium]